MVERLRWLLLLSLWAAVLRHLSPHAAAASVQPTVQPMVQPTVQPTVQVRQAISFSRSGLEVLASFALVRVPFDRHGRGPPGVEGGDGEEGVAGEEGEEGEEGGEKGGRVTEKRNFSIAACAACPFRAVRASQSSRASALGAWFSLVAPDEDGEEAEAAWYIAVQMESGGTPRTTGWRLSMPGQAPNASRPIKTHMPPLEMIIINVSPASSKVEGDTTDPQTLPSVAEQLHEGALGAWYSLQSALPDDFVADNADSASNTTKKRKPRADLAKVSDTISLIENRIRAHQRGSLLSTSSSEKSTPCDAVSIGYINCVKRHNSAGECLDHKRELMSCREQIGLANPSGVADDSFEAQRSARQVSQKQYYNRDEDQNKNKNKNKNIIKNDLPAGFSFRACSTAGGGCPSGGGTPDGAIAEKLGVPARPTMMQPTPLGPDVSDAGGTLMMSVVQIVLGTGINTLIKKFALYSRKKVNPMLQLSLIDGIPSMGNMEASAKPNGPTGTTKSLPSFGDLPFGDLKRLKPGETPADATPGPAAAGLAAPAVGGGAGQPSYGMAPQPDPPAAGKAPSKPPTATAATKTAAF